MHEPRLRPLLCMLGLLASPLTATAEWNTDLYGGASFTMNHDATITSSFLGETLSICASIAGGVEGTNAALCRAILYDSSPSHRRVHASSRSYR